MYWCLYQIQYTFLVHNYRFYNVLHILLFTVKLMNLLLNFNLKSTLSICCCALNSLYRKFTASINLALVFTFKTRTYGCRACLLLLCTKFPPVENFKPRENLMPQALNLSYVHREILMPQALNLSYVHSGNLMPQALNLSYVHRENLVPKALNLSYLYPGKI